jgi:hypothetical protein
LTAKGKDDEDSDDDQRIQGENERENFSATSRR